MKKLNNKILYLSFHNSLKKKFGVNRIIHKKEIIIKLGRQFLVPKNLRVLALKELENMGLFKQESRDHFKILEGFCDLEENPKEFFGKISLCLFCFY